MKVYYDLHMHSCLSPCGADDMTPNNLVHMAALAGLEVIALSDHNTTRNVPAAVAVGKECGVLVVPAMELTTKEDIHVLCLLPSVEAAEELRQYVYPRLPQRKRSAGGRGCSSPRPLPGAWGPWGSWWWPCCPP